MKTRNWKVAQDPTELRLFAVQGEYEYESGKWAKVWIAREMSEDNAKLLAHTPKLVSVCEKALASIEEYAEYQILTGVDPLRRWLQDALNKVKGER